MELLRAGAAQDMRAAGAEFDMFAEEAQEATAAAGKSAAAAAGLADSYDDVDGYYNLQAPPCCAGSPLSGSRPHARRRGMQGASCHRSAPTCSGQNTWLHQLCSNNI